MYNKSTEQIVYEMISQNTGTHILDSGGAYGRHWERNQKHTLTDFKESPDIVYSAHVYRDGELSLDVTKSLFHHLVNNLNYEEYVDKLFHRFVDIYIKEFYEYWDDERNCGYGDFDWNKAMKCFCELVRKDRKGNRQWISWEFEGEEWSGYTYNDENILSQDFVYDVMGGWVFIQSHNGCDARGGFSWPHLFQLKDDVFNLLNFNDYTVSCSSGHWWDFNGGYENTEQDMYLLKEDKLTPTARVIDADNKEWLEIEEEYNQQVREWKANKRAYDLSSPLPGMDKPEFTQQPDIVMGCILVKDNKMSCPICGEELKVSCY